MLDFKQHTSFKSIFQTIWKRKILEKELSFTGKGLKKWVGLKKKIGDDYF